MFFPPDFNAVDAKVFAEGAEENSDICVLRDFSAFSALNSSQQAAAQEKPMAIEGACHCGSVRWHMVDVPESGTVCNCSACRRYGVVWAYGFESDGIDVSGQTKTYAWGRQWLEFHFCLDCGCIVYWRAQSLEDDGRRPMGVNLRLAPPEAVRAIPLTRHDTETKADLPPDGRCIADLWF